MKTYTPTHICKVDQPIFTPKGNHLDLSAPMHHSKNPNLCQFTKPPIDKIPCSSLAAQAPLSNQTMLRNLFHKSNRKPRMALHHEPQIVIKDQKNCLQFHISIE